MPAETDELGPVDYIVVEFPRCARSKPNWRNC